MSIWESVKGSPLNGDPIVVVVGSGDPAEEKKAMLNILNFLFQISR